MGVKHLTSFMHSHRHVPDGATKINLINAIEEHQRKYPEKKPLIVFDLLGCRTICQPMEEALCGFRSNQYRSRLREFLTQLIDAGAELVFFEDGCLVDQKEATWFERRTYGYMKDLEVIDEIIKGTPTKDILCGKWRELNRKMLEYFLFVSVIKEIGLKLFTVVDAECDLALAAYATENHALAVVADDTDFIIFPGKWFVWSITDLNVEQMTTMEYNKEALMNALRLTEEQLPLFATLMGNDILQYNDVIKFHDYLNNGNQVKSRLGKFFKVASYIRDRPSHFTERDLRIMARTVASNNAWERCLELIKTSLDSYNYEKLSEVKRENDPLLEKFISDRNITPYKILKGFSITIHFYNEDFRDSSKKSITELALTIQQRLFGIFLKYKNESKIFRTVYCKESHEEGFKRLDIPVIFPEFEIPNLEQLCIRVEDDGLDEIRMKLFAWLYHDAFNPFELFKLDKKFIPLLAILAFLIQEANFTIDDADILLCAYYDVYVNRVPVGECIPEFLDINAFKHTFCLLGIAYKVQHCLEGIGLKDYVVPMIFDGIHYHHLYQQWKLWEQEAKDKRLDEVKQFRAIYTEAK